MDLIGSLGNFSMLAMLLNTFQVDLQAVEPRSPTCAVTPASQAGRPSRKSANYIEL